MYQALAQSGVEAAFLELELTESALMENIDAMLDTLREFDELGVQPPSTTLAPVTQLGLSASPADWRAENRPLVCQRSGNRPARRADCRGHPGHGAFAGPERGGRRRETDAQFAFLAAKGCGYVQGWWLAKSMPAAELERWMAEYDIGAVAERISQARQPRAVLLG